MEYGNGRNSPAGLKDSRKQLETPTQIMSNTPQL